ncbi:hypothetical protein LCGC14_1112080 [marine sediment metagenome]|uniref:Uncharacterized protein n=1 Tax=marine sediment metagenome TaxID=412755 RepID=A0A0F9QCI8_9ZZZZ
MTTLLLDENKAKWIVLKGDPGYVNEAFSRYRGITRDDCASLAEGILHVSLLSSL